MTKTYRLPTAHPQWSKEGVLRATNFEDVYFSTDGGAEEARHVFLQGNNLPQRFAALAEETTPHIFTIGELGFGTGLNISCLLQEWARHDLHQHHLQLISIEGFPLGAGDFEKARQHISSAWPELKPFAANLARHYPPLAKGRHHRQLAPNISLILLFDDVLSALNQLDGIVDAWFLDGFSPSKNPQMWCTEVFAQLSRLSPVATTIATFSVAGSVRRGLTAAGFAVEKRPGFGRKRDMLVARKDQPSQQSPRSKPWFTLPKNKPRETQTKIAIVGAGIAGACLTYQLRQAGFSPVLYDGNGPASGASGNPVGLIMPRLDLGHTDAADFYSTAFYYGVQFISKLEYQTNTTLLQRGAVRLAITDGDQSKHTKILETALMPADWAAPLSIQETEEKAGIALHLAQEGPHLFFPHGGTLNPTSLIQALLRDIDIREHNMSKASRQPNGKWIITTQTENGLQESEVDIVILANGIAAQHFLPQHHELAGSLGQIDIFNYPPPHIALSGGGYCASLDAQMIGGATYDPFQEKDPAPWSQQRARANIRSLQKFLPELSNAHIVAEAGRCSIRCVTPDQHPMAGPVPDFDYYTTHYDGLRHGAIANYPSAQYQNGLYVMTGLGSRGLSTAPILAAHIVSQLTGTLSPLSPALSDLIHPARYLIRKLIRNQV
ncbi:MAG: bifunctional tRNA (5-methylaminomethyl-2-thiouridine)(34)-methyltransferase MnmD/FAD-dependent 5-carboxymethylaminomethyl-2-thiouridine(34) oxidoreductase MnmC [bacterium]